MEPTYEIGEGTLSDEGPVEEQKFYANFDMLYDRTLADFQYCFFYYAINKYLKAGIDKIVWSQIRHQGASKQRTLQLRRERWEIKAGGSTQQKLQEYNNYCASLLFAERHHAKFFQCLHQFACKIISSRDIDNKEFFNADETLQVCRAISLMMDPHKPTTDALEEAFRQDISKYSGKHPYMAVRDRLTELLHKWEAEGDISEPGPRMKYYKYAGTQLEPSANSIYYTNFRKFIEKFEGGEKLPMEFKLPQPGLIREPGMFKDILFRDLVDHPEDFDYSFADLGVDAENWYKLDISSFELFKNAHPERDWVVTGAQSQEDMGFMNDLRANIYLMLRLNDNLLGYGTFATDITRAQGNSLSQFEISPDGHKKEFWNLQSIDWTSTIDKRNWPRGVMVPKDWMTHLVLIDNMYLRLGIRAGGETYIRSKSETARLAPVAGTPEVTEKTLSKENHVRFSKNVDVINLPRNSSLVKGAKVEGADDKKATPLTKEEKKDETNLRLIIGSIAAFFGLYYITSD